MAQARRKPEPGRNGQENIFLKSWMDSYSQISRMWEDSYLNLHKPWIETTGQMFEKAAELSSEPSPQNYQSFFEDWMKAYERHFGRTYPVRPIETNKETLEKLMAGAEESIALYKSWISELESNTKKTKETLKGSPDQAEYEEAYDSWISSYEKIFEQLLTLPSMESTKEVFEQYSGVPDIYFGSFVRIARLWRESYARLYEPWIETASRLSHKISQMSQGETSPEDYREFFDLWMNAYQDAYSDYVRSMQPTKETFDSFLHGTDTYLDMYKAWISALEKMAEKTSQLSKEAGDPEVSKEFYVLWTQMYEKAFGSFFEDMPTEGPMQEMMEPVKMMAKLNADTFARMSKMWASKQFSAPGRE